MAKSEKPMPTVGAKQTAGAGTGVGRLQIAKMTEKEMKGKKK